MNSDPFFLLDTNVLSEMRRPAPNTRVTGWLLSAPVERLRISVLTLGEIAKGVAMLRRRGEPARADAMGQWLDYLRSVYLRRTVDVDEAVALRWGELAGLHPTLPPIDGLLAATALVHGFTLVTRNVRDVAQTGVALLNPWE